MYVDTMCECWAQGAPAQNLPGLPADDFCDETPLHSIRFDHDEAQLLTLKSSRWLSKGIGGKACVVLPKPGQRHFATHLPRSIQLLSHRTHPNMVPVPAQMLK